MQGRWDIALRDLEYALGVDQDGDGEITWGEVKLQYENMVAYTFTRLSLTAREQSCTLNANEQLIEQHSDGAYAVLKFSTDCPSRVPLTLDYRLFFDLDPTHRGLVKVIYPDAIQSLIASPERSQIALQSRKPDLWQTFIDYWREGVWHIWIGFDHCLFLFTLLLPAALRRDNEFKRWRSAQSLRQVLLEVSAIVTAFTVAHSITLSAAALGWIMLPSQWVESAIAATVVLVALNNLYPIIQTKRWLLASGLGLIHGFGFASVLTDLGLPDTSLILALAAFNLGVESGQLVIIAGLLPGIYLLSRFTLYQKAALPFASLAAMTIASVWLLERSLMIRIGLIT